MANGRNRQILYVEKVDRQADREEIHMKKDLKLESMHLVMSDIQTHPKTPHTSTPHQSACQIIRAGAGVQVGKHLNLNHKT